MARLLRRFIALHRPVSLVCPLRPGEWGLIRVMATFVGWRSFDRGSQAIGDAEWESPTQLLDNLDN